jgi:uncharacterized cupredoxin-like copper-binding protein
MNRRDETERLAGSRWLRVAVAAGAAAALAAGCGGGNSPPATGTGGTAGGQTVTVAETDFKLALSTSTFKPGTYTFAVRNMGKATHALEVEGPGVGERKSDTVSPGESTSLTVTLQQGTYELYCPVDNHKDLGMETKITVG